MGNLIQQFNVIRNDGLSPKGWKGKIQVICLLACFSIYFISITTATSSGLTKRVKNMFEGDALSEMRLFKYYKPKNNCFIRNKIEAISKMMKPPNDEPPSGAQLGFSRAGL